MTTCAPSRTAPFRRLTAFLVAALAVALAACGSTTTFRQAQDAFSRAASIDNARTLRLDRTPAVEPDTGALGEEFRETRAAEVLYESALADIGAVLSTDTAELQRDGLYGNALTLKALCEWRLGRWDDADETAADAAGLDAGAVGPRDAALLVAIPGLIRNDQAHARLVAWADGDTVDADGFEAARDLLADERDGALKHLAAARAKAGGHPVATYLLLAELAALKNLNDAFDTARSAGTGIQTGSFQPFRDRAQEVLNEYARREPPGAARTRMIHVWAVALGLSEPTP